MFLWNGFARSENYAIMKNEISFIQKRVSPMRKTLALFVLLLCLLCLPALAESTLTLPL